MYNHIIKKNTIAGEWNMIIDTLSNIDSFLPYMNGRLKKALMFLKNNNLHNLQGRVEIERDDIYLAVSDYETKPKCEKKAETHKKYIDIQIVTKGAERVYTQHWNTDIQVVEPYSESCDATFYNPSNEDSHVLENDVFAIYFPWDVHRPGCNVQDSSQNVRKIVVKVRAD